MKKLWEKIHNFILPMATVGLALLLVLSYLFPNKVLDTYQMNISAEGVIEEAVDLPEGSIISYAMNTGQRPLRGIQPGLGLQGGLFLEGILRYRVYRQGSNTPVSDNEYSLKEVSEGIRDRYFERKDSEDAEALFYEPMYLYLPLDNYTECKGEIRIEFTYESNGETVEYIGEPAEEQSAGRRIVPCLFVNEVRREGTRTEHNGKVLTGGLTGYYVYTHNTYPLVYDLRILVFVCLAASAVTPVRFPGKPKRTEDLS